LLIGGVRGASKIDRCRLDSVFEAELADVIPICQTTIAGTRIVGRLTAGYVRYIDGWAGESMD